jgi:glycosyltransferase involved in cell wall biosynthesis
VLDRGAVTEGAGARARPAVSVLIPTFRRPAIVRRGLSLLAENLQLSNGVIHVLVSSDDPTDGTQEMIAEASSVRRDDFTVTYLDGPQNGLGANLSSLLSAAKTDLCLQMDDDHLLLAPLSLDRRCQEIGLSKGGPHVLIPIFLEPPETWAHVGDSWQEKGF